MGRIGPYTAELCRIQPIRFTEVIEREVSSLFLKRMGIDPKHEGRIGVAKRVGYLADISADSRPIQTALKPKWPTLLMMERRPFSLWSVIVSLIDELNVWMITFFESKNH